MIVPKDELEVILAGDVAGVVRRVPLTVGETCWLRRSPRRTPECLARVVDVWAVEGGHEVLLERVRDGFARPRRVRAVRPDFRVSAEQREWLLAGGTGPLEFDEKPHGCEPGARYVLAWKRVSVTVLDADTGECAVTPAHPAWFITVTKVARGRAQGDPSRLVWQVRFEVTDRRDPDLWLSRSGDYQFTRHGAVDELPVAPSDETRLKAIQERDHLARLQRHAAKLKAASRSRARRNAA